MSRKLKIGDRVATKIKSEKYILGTVIGFYGTVLVEIKWESYPDSTYEREDSLIPEEIFSSPLFKALKEY